MGVIWTSKTRTTQPAYPVRSGSSPIARGLKYLVSAQTLGFNAVSGVLSTPTTVLVASIAPRVGGVAIAHNDGGFTVPSGGVELVTNSAISAMVLCRPISGTEVLFGSQAVGYGTVNWRIRLTGIYINIEVYNEASTLATAQLYLASFYSSTTPFVVGFTYSEASGTVTAYCQGASVVTAAQTGKVKSSAVPLNFGAVLGGDGDYVGETYAAAIWDRILSEAEFVSLYRNPWQLFAPEKRPLFFSTGGGGANTTGTLSSTLDAATLTGVGGVARSGTLVTTLDAATLTGVGNVTRSGTLAVTLDAATLSGTGAVTISGTLNSTLDAATLAGVGSVAVGTNRDGTLAVTLDAATLAGVGAVTRSGTLAVTLDAATLAGIGTAGQAVTGTLGVTLGNVTLAGIGAIPAAPSAGGGKTFGSNKKKKKQRKAIESEEWLKAEETAKQLLQDRFTKTTPEAKLEALASHIESLQPVIEALKALAKEDVQEAVQETRTEELTEHQLVLNRFDALEKKIESVEELLIILMADL